jgi:integrase
MISIKFYLKPGKTNKNGEKPILISIGVGKEYPIRKHIGHVVPTKKWSKAKQHVKISGPQDELNYGQINRDIEALKRKINGFYTDSINNEYVLTKELVKSKLNTFNVNNFEDKLGFFDAFQKYIDVSRSSKAKRTTMGYQTVFNFLKNYCSFAKDYIDFHTVNNDFFDNLSAYAYEEREVNDNYFAKIIRVLKSFMKWAAERDYHKNEVYKNFKASEKEKEVIYLTKEELKKLYVYQFKTKRLEKARDLYCFACFTGLRYSDIIGLKKDHIKNNEIYKSITKGKKTNTIPLTTPAINILNKYSDIAVYALPKISGQNLNKYIKEACKIAEINDLTPITKYIGGKAIEISKPKYELITFHTAKKTFITNSLILGMNQKTIKSVTGNKRDDIFNKYLKIAEDYKKTEMDNAWGSFV